ncbi:hypothetical protein C8R43DRAFT_995613 [Mycena crocata]|nr:hypothetical protein C8R43DRAFT_995613 [Mycena crocata]
MTSRKSSRKSENTISEAWERYTQLGRNAVQITQIGLRADLWLGQMSTLMKGVHITDTEHLPDGRLALNKTRSRDKTRPSLTAADAQYTSRVQETQESQTRPRHRHNRALRHLCRMVTLAPAAPMHHAQRRVLVLSSQPRMSSVRVFALRLSYAAVGTSQRSSASSSRSSLRRVEDDVPSRVSAHAQTRFPRQMRLLSRALVVPTPGRKYDSGVRTDAVASSNGRSTPTALHVSKNADPRRETLLALTPTRPGCTSLARECSWSVYTGRIVSCAQRQVPAEFTSGRTLGDTARTPTRTRRPRLSARAPAMPL